MATQMTSKSLTDGAVVIALTVMFFLGSIWIPAVGSFLLFFAGVPLMVLCVKQNIKTAIIAAIGAAILVMILLGPIYALSFVLQIEVMSLAFGYMIKKRKGAGKTLVIGVFSAVIAFIVMMCFSALLTGLPIQDMVSYLEQLKTETYQMYEQSGMIESLQSAGYSSEEIKQAFDTMVNLIISMIPFALTFSTALLAMANYLITIKVLRRMQIKVRRLPRFEKWYLPGSVTYGLLIALVLWLMAGYLQIKWLDIFSKNLLAGFAVCFFVIGLAVLAHWTKYRKQSRGIKLFSVAIVLFSILTGAAMLIVFIGMFDMLMDFRKIHQQDNLLPKIFRKE